MSFRTALRWNQRRLFLRLEVCSKFTLALLRAAAQLLVVELMTTSHTIRALWIIALSVFVVGCGPHSEMESLGSLDLTTKGAKCAFNFTWNSHNPCLEFILSDTNGAPPVGSHPGWPLGILVDVFDKGTGKLLVSSDVASTNMMFTNWELPATSLELITPEFYDVLHNTNSYKFVVTVLQGEKSAGLASVKMAWVVGGDSM